jgi:hypothetical protein
MRNPEVWQLEVSFFACVFVSFGPEIEIFMQKHESPDIRLETDTWVFRLRRIYRGLFSDGASSPESSEADFCRKASKERVSLRLEADVLCSLLELAVWPGVESAWADCSWLVR